MATTIAAPPRSGPPPTFAGGRGPRPLPAGTQRLGISLALAAISMMFIGLTSAYVVSQGLNPVWKQIHMRLLIWIDTGILLFSSYTMEQARRRKAINWLLATLLLGLAFLAGQIGVFAQVANEGFYLNTGRQASFYYVLTGLHGLHIVGGIFALRWAAFRMKNSGLAVTSALEVSSIYWHFMDALWIFLLLVIFI